MSKIIAKKKFGQNFIHDEKLITKIVDLLGHERNSLVIEIGPGTGALTKKLVERFDQVVAIEIDQEMEPILKQKIQAKNFDLIIEDALTIDLEKLIKKYQYKDVYLISNMPYYITSEILFKTFKISSLLKKAVFMMQKEVALRVCANVNDSDYNNLSIATEFYAKRTYEFTVHKGMFHPIPKVDSAIVSLVFDDKFQKQIKDEEKFLAMVRNLFNNKRKTILNNLGRFLNDKNQAKIILEKAKIKESFRPENLTLENYLTIFKLLKIS